MKINIDMTSESASKKQQDNAKLLFGAKGKTLITALDALFKMKKHLSEDESALVRGTQEFLKTSLDEKSIVRLRKRKGFLTLPTRLSKLNKAVTAKTKIDMAPILKQFAPVQKHISKFADKGSAKYIATSIGEITNGVKRDTSIITKSLAKLKPLSAKLKKLDINIYNDIMNLLKTDATSNPKSHNAKVLERLPGILKALSTIAPKYVKASEQVNLAFKGLPAFTKLMSAETAKSVGTSMDKKSEKAAKKVAPKPSKGKVKVGLKTKAEPSGIEESLNVMPEFMKSIYKGAALKNPTNNQSATQVEAKGSLVDVGLRFIKQLRKKPEFKNAMIGINSGDTFEVKLNDGSGKSITLTQSRTAGKFNLGPSNNNYNDNILSDGAKVYAMPSLLGKLDMIRSELQFGSAAAPDVETRRNAKKFGNALDKLSTSLEMGTTIAKLRTAVSALPNDISDRIEQNAPEIMIVAGDMVKK